MSFGASMLSMSLIAAGFLLLAIWAWHAGHSADDEIVHHNRLLEELKRQPVPERDPWEMDAER